MRPARIEIHIHELAWDGVSPLDRQAVGEAVRDELVRALSGDPLWQEAPPHVGGPVDVNAGSVGRVIAGAVYRRVCA